MVGNGGGAGGGHGQSFGVSDGFSLGSAPCFDNTLICNYIVQINEQ
jgi:hypothetical protein